MTMCQTKLCKYSINYEYVPRIKNRIVFCDVFMNKENILIKVKSYWLVGV